MLVVPVFLEFVLTEKQVMYVPIDTYNCIERFKIPRKSTHSWLLPLAA